MKNLIYLCAFMALLITGCSDDDNNNGTDDSRKISLKASQIDNVPSDIYEIKAVTYENDRPVATALWDNGFELELPETVPSTSLQSIGEEISFSSEISVSNKDTKAVGVRLAGYDKEGKWIVDLTQNKITSEEQYIMVDYLYCDSDCKITGTDTYEDLDGKRTVKYDCSFKKGWNTLEYRYLEHADGSWEDVFTTSLSSGLKWGFISW